MQTTMKSEIDVEKRWSMLCHYLLFMLNEGRDAKIIVVGRGGSTGTGKTTLAVLIAKWVHSLLRCTNCSRENEHGETVGGLFPPEFNQCPWCGGNEVIKRPPWSAESAFINVMDYCYHYANESRPGDAMILDEAEKGADKRRAMAKENVKLSHAWSSLRYKNNVSILTLPSTLHIDKRMEELGDVMINVQRRGLAHIYWYWLNDFEKTVSEMPVRNPAGRRELIKFNGISDEEYLRVTAMKESHFFADNSGGDDGYYTGEELDSEVQKQMRDMRKTVAIELDGKTDLNQTEIGEVVEMSQQWVSKALNDKL